MALLGLVNPATSEEVGYTGHEGHEGMETFSEKNRIGYITRRPRLPSFSYRGRFRYFLTVCARDRNECFRDGALVKLVINVLRGCSNQEGFSVWAYCFMPDHLHLLVEGRQQESDLRRFIFKFKQKSGYLVSREYGLSLWQKSYYDHILRPEEDIREFCRYIWDNPVRGGLVEHYREYRNSGSMVDGVWGYGNGGGS